MKKYLAIFFVFSTLTAVTAFAGKDEYNTCHKKCMKQFDNDKDKCDYICEPLLND